MGYLKNLLIFSAIAMLVVGCGGGNTTIANNATPSTTQPTTAPTAIPSPTTTGSVTLTWTAPKTYQDGTAITLSDITGYRLYYGPSATNTPNYVNINGGSATQYTISLPSGSYYFRISAIDSSGYEGLMSTAIEKTL